MKKAIKKKSYFKEVTEECGCGDKRCGKLYIQFAGRNMIEINFIPYRCKKVKFGVVLKDRQLDKFRKLVADQEKFDKNFKIKKR